MRPVPGTRLYVLAGWLAATAVAGAAGLLPEEVPPGRPLASLPLQLGEWSGQASVPLSSDVVTTLGVDDYVNRVYVTRTGQELALYVGYYRSQRQGDAIHSPLNCLPGAGWQIVRRDERTVPLSGDRAPLLVNQMTIRKGLTEQVVRYWYQSHGRVVAGEFASKVLLVWDAMRYRRSDAAFVRVITPELQPGTPTERSLAGASGFVQVLFPSLEAVLPS